MEIKKILVPLDGSPESEKAFTFGLDLAEKYDARLVLAHIRLDTMVRIGAPPQTLLSMAEDTGADLIVMGSRGLGAVRSIVMGSVSQYILHHARAMVTIVK